MQKTAYEMRISDWSSDVCSSDLGFARHLHAIGPHIGDQPVLVELLGEPHGVAGREVELPRRLLLEGRGGEGRLRVERLRLGFDRGDAERSEARRVGNAWGSQGRSRWAAYP